MKKFSRIIAAYIATVFMLMTVVGCSYATPPTVIPPQLDVPAVTIDAEGVASWNSVDGAVYYIYVIDEGAEIPTDVCSVRLDHNDSIKVKAVSGTEQYADSDFSIYKTYLKSSTGDDEPPKGDDDPPNKEDPPKGDDEPPVKTKLAAPTVTIDDDGVAAWNSVANASSYVYVINNGGENSTEDRFVRLADKDSIKVKAVSASELYTDSDYSQTVTYIGGTTPIVVTKLATPTVEIDDDGVATWNSIANAVSYAYVINNGGEKSTTTRSVRLADKDSIKVKAVSGGEQYNDSDFSLPKTYTKPVDDPIQEVPLSAEAKAYYSGITAKNGDALLGQVHDLITKTHKTYTSYTDCKDPSIIVKTDQGSTANYVMDFYTQEDMSKAWGSGAQGTWNREHVWCQSLSNGMWGESYGGSDLHHIRPTESSLNSSRGNNKFGVVTNGTPAYFKGSNGNIVGGYRQGGSTFEPLDKVKGDVARIVMYVYTHYNTYANVHGTTNGSGGKFGTLNFTHVVTASNEDAAIALLIQWCKADPVDAIEIARNEAVYKIQGNRNPFIDHPEYAVAIWG